MPTTSPRGSSAITLIFTLDPWQVSSSGALWLPDLVGGFGFIDRCQTIHEQFDGFGRVLGEIEPQLDRFSDQGSARRQVWGQAPDVIEPVEIGVG